MARIESGRMEIDENYGMIEDIWQTYLKYLMMKQRKRILHFIIR